MVSFFCLPPRVVFWGNYNSEADFRFVIANWKNVTYVIGTEKRETISIYLFFPRIQKNPRSTEKNWALGGMRSHNSGFFHPTRFTIWSSEYFGHLGQQPYGRKWVTWSLENNLFLCEYCSLNSGNDLVSVKSSFYGHGILSFPVGRCLRWDESKNGRGFFLLLLQIPPRSIARSKTDFDYFLCGFSPHGISLNSKNN